MKVKGFIMEKEKRNTEKTVGKQFLKMIIKCCKYASEFEF